MGNKRGRWIIGTVVVTALVAGLYVGFFTSDVERGRSGWGQSVGATVLPGPKELLPFNLTDHTGSPFTLDSLRGRWSFLFFGYTYCPDICPASLTTLALMDKKLRSDGLSIPYQVVFVSIDPARDDVARLAEYVSYFNPSFIGVTGSDAELSGMTRQLGVLYAKAPQAEGDEYLMDHSAAIILIDPEGRFHAVFSAPHKPLEMAEDFVKIAG
ncbi:MAG: SCO family protein [Gammaproteobacteria bacterium]|nr:SCO family protein [Gammaproteobacteria bacterium]